MTAEAERRALQICIGFACLVPVLAGLSGIFESATGMRGVEGAVPVDLDSHFRYLSGLLLGIGICFAACIAHVEKKSGLFRALGFIVVVGGMARLVSLIQAGMPGAGHQFGLAMELGVVPLLVIWQARVARRSKS